ncbi:FAD-dependent oxidoreductase [Sulfurimonas sp. HSL3-7]|uniref:FAD-dependent oxidoreductase n=1 Tax=Sulfonitrofixus jiaomeiensis TaxID=3131938 RepID=UPI0031F8B108
MPEVVSEKPKIAVVGGGIAGSTIALYLSEIGLNVSLFEKGPSLVNGPPICHLHAGGNLYRDISDQQCLTLLKESIDLVRFYPNAVDYRPTVIAVPTDDSGRPQDLLPRLKKLQAEYAKLIKYDPRNKVLGESADYFKLYDRSQVEALKEQPTVEKPLHLDDWIIPVAKNIDLEKVQFPLIMVQEYGLNLFRLASSARLSLDQKENCQLLLNHKVTDIAKSAEKSRWLVTYQHEGRIQHEAFDFLINAAGFKTGKLDDLLGFKRERLVEFKAAYVSRWDECKTTWPEVIFFGERGTPKGMAQFTPYPGGYFQLHGMTKSITLFEEGLVRSSAHSAQPQLDRKFLDKIDNEWTPSEVKTRTRLAINHVAHYIPAFEKASVVPKPLYGAQQIPGRDASLRAADVSFVDDHYARCEIVKASSVLSMADAITKQLITLGYVDKGVYGKRDFATVSRLDDKQISRYAESLCRERNYPVSLTQRTVAN